MAGFKRGYDGKIAGLYDLDKTLGRGHFAVVKLARHVFTGEKVAVKVIDKTKLDTVATGHLFQEVRCMKLVQHPNIVRLYEVIDTQTKLYLILELGDGGDMFDYIMKHEEGLNEELAKKYFAQIVHAISYCHRLHVVHRDLKPENVVFFEKQGLVKLTDFGFSNKFQPGKKLTTSCGSLAYSAPEILLGDEYDAPAVDIWSLGVILFMLVCGQPPFQEANDSETLTMIMDCKYTVPAHVSNACEDLIDRMLQRDPKGRASLDEIEGHAWLQGVDPSPATKFNTPLVSHKSLSEEEHSGIIQRMVLGDITDRETIVEALETNKYNHITATYYLLAERTLREKQEKEVQTRSSSPSNANKAQFRQSWPSRVDMHQDIEDSLATASMAGGPQSPARSAENLLNGHRASKPLELGRREDLTDSPPPLLWSRVPPGPRRAGSQAENLPVQSGGRRGGGGRGRLRPPGRAGGPAPQAPLHHQPPHVPQECARAQPDLRGGGRVRRRHGRGPAAQAQPAQDAPGLHRRRRRPLPPPQEPGARLVVLQLGDERRRLGEPPPAARQGLGLQLQLEPPGQQRGPPRELRGRRGRPGGWGGRG
ncbi:unnamed protein product [Gadus morhua 'NCC']